MGAINFSIDAGLVAFLKQQLPLEVFVETGTFRGDTLQLARQWFPECHSVELSPELHAAAQARFAGNPSVHLHKGTSPEFLSSQRDYLASKPVLYWLDAHWCGGAGEDAQSPLMGELEAIGRLHPQSVVLVDDARLYQCPPGVPHRYSDWPDFHDTLQAFIALSPSHRLMIINDIIVFFPQALKSALSRYAHEHGVDLLTIANEARKLRRRQQTWAKVRRPWKFLAR